MAVTKAAITYGTGSIGTSAPVYKPSTAAQGIQTSISSTQAQIDDLQKQIDAGNAQVKADPSVSGSVNISGETAHQNDLKAQLANYNSQLNDQTTQDKNAFQVQDQFYNLANEQQNAADQFKTAMPSIVENQLAPLRVQARQAIAQGVGQNKANYNSRGLLYSGLRAGGEADVGANVSNQLNSDKATINQNLGNEQLTLDQAPINTQLAGSALQGAQAGVNNDYTNSILDALMNQSQTNNAAVNNLLGAGGALAGAAAGGLISNPVKAPTTSLASQNPALYQPVNLNPSTGGAYPSLY